MNQQFHKPMQYIKTSKQLKEETTLPHYLPHDPAGNT